jgi:hypothetical protein
MTAAQGLGGRQSSSARAKFVLLSPAAEHKAPLATTSGLWALGLASEAPTICLRWLIHEAVAAVACRRNGRDQQRRNGVVHRQADRCNLSVEYTVPCEYLVYMHSLVSSALDPPLAFEGGSPAWH